MLPRSSATREDTCTKRTNAGVEQQLGSVNTTLFHGTYHAVQHTILSTLWNTQFYLSREKTYFCLTCNSVYPKEHMLLSWKTYSSVQKQIDNDTTYRNGSHSAWLSYCNDMVLCTPACLQQVLTTINQQSDWSIVIHLSSHQIINNYWQQASNPLIQPQINH